MKTPKRFLSMASTALLLALVWSVTSPQSALAAITCQWEPSTGTLTVTSNGSDNITITCDTAHPPAAVLVNGKWDILGTGRSVEAKDVKM
jgi:hypothetical protein